MKIYRFFLALVPRRKNLLSLLSLGFISLALALPAAAQNEDFTGGIRIGIIGDQTFSTDIQASYNILQQGVNILSDQDLDVVLHVGDLVESTLPPAQVTALYNQAAGILNQLPVTWYLTAGDHDVNPPGFQQDSPDRSREQLFQQLYGQRVPAFLTHPWYSFNVNGYHFIALYSHQALHADPRFGNIFLAQIYDDQFQFLANDLEANKNAKSIIVFIHQPLWYHWSGWQRVHELLRKYRVGAVVSGHFHYDQNNGRIDNIRYLTVGATGGVTKNGDRDAGDIQHVSVLRVSGQQERIRLLPITDNQPLKLTPRVDMDRVQALDVQLGNFFDFDQRNPVFLQNGQLVAACGTNQPARVQITQIGNPIDLPVDVQIQFNNPPGVTLSSPGFLPGQCQQAVGNFECVLARTARTFVSNYSSVQINEFGDPLWQSGLTATSGGPQAGTLLSFRITTAFQGESGNLFLETTVSTTVQACP
jgi:hypothetical protein